MGILDDLAMGFGMKARTEDYDARTARTIALNERFGTGPNADVMGRSRALANKDYDVTSGQAARFLASRGRENYNPQIISRDQDDRSFFQRALYSPESPESPRPYAIGPMKLDGPLQIPSIGIMGILQDFAEGFRQPQDRGPVTNNEAAQSSGLIGSTDDDVALFEDLIIRANGESAGRAIIDAIGGDFEKLRGAAEKAQQTIENVGPYE